MSINLKYRDELPANISKTYLEYSDEQNTIREMGLLFDIFSQTLRFFGCIFSSELMNDSERYAVYFYNGFELTVKRKQGDER